MKRLGLTLTLVMVGSSSTFAQTQPASRGKWCHKGVEAYLAAAKTGDVDSMLCMGTKYANYGNEVPRDDVQATIWFRKAAEGGQRSGMFLVGIAFWSGRGEKQDFTEAYKWLDLAARRGNTSAVTSLESIARVMSPQMISEAKSRAAEWEKAFQKRKKS